MIDLAKIKEMAAEKRKKNDDDCLNVLANSIGNAILNKLVEDPAATKAYRRLDYYINFEDNTYYVGDMVFYLNQSNLWDYMVQNFKDEGVTLKLEGFFNRRITITWS